MKTIGLFILLSTLMTSCMDGFGFRYNPVNNFKDLKDWVTGESSEFADTIFEKRAYCYYFNREGLEFLRAKTKSIMDDIQVDADFTPGKTLYTFKIKHDGMTIATGRIKCHHRDSAHWCSITELAFTQGQEYPDHPVCADLPK